MESSSFVDSTTNHSHNSSHRSENQSNHTHHQYLQQSKHNEDHNSLPLSTALLIAIPIIILVLILAIVLLVIFMVRRRQSNSSKNNPGRRDDRIADKKSILMMAHTTVNIAESPDLRNGFVSLGGGGDSSRLSSSRRSRGVQVFTYKELEMATDDFNEGNVVGNGGYGVVYKGALKDGTLVAIKMLHKERKQGERAFRTEVDLLSRLHSPHLVELLGYCADQNHRLLVFEFMTNGSLQNHLQKPSSSLSSTQSSLLDWRTRLRIALDCARALEYLHEHASIIHRDFKCSNVLLDHNLRAKVSDFGLAKMGSEKINGQISTRVLGTTGYLAPEYVSTGKLTTKSDVYSYGVVLLQLITGRVPVDTKRPPGEHVLVSWALPRLTNREKVIEMVDPDIKGQCSKKELVQVAAIAAVCVQAEADYRPLMTDVVQSLVPLAKNFSLVPSKSARFYNHLNSASL